MVRQITHMFDLLNCKSNYIFLFLIVIDIVQKNSLTICPGDGDTFEED